MSAPFDPTALLERLDRIEALLGRLVAAVESSARDALPRAEEPPAPTQPVAAPRADEPPRIRVAPPGAVAARAPVTAASPAPAPEAAIAATPETPPAAAPRWSPAEGDGPPVPGPEAPIAAIVERLFEAALEPKADDTWAVLMRLFHSSQLVGPRALDHFKGFAWTRLRRNAKIYLPDGTASSFRIAYTDPADLRGHEREVRLFIKTVDDRMPVPLVLTRDPAAGNAWRVSNISL
jgi:hypothetical protein